MTIYDCLLLSIMPIIMLRIMIIILLFVQLHHVHLLGDQPAVGQSFTPVQLSVSIYDGNITTSCPSYKNNLNYIITFLIILPCVDSYCIVYFFLTPND